MSDWGAEHVIMGRYRLVSILGSGGMGSVWRAEHLQLKTEVAVKLLDPAIAKDEQVVARFIREARSTAALRNRHVVQIFDYGVEDDNAFIVMEMLHGETLGSRIERNGTLPVDETVKFMCQVMRAMSRAHELGIVHRDLKPENIFVCSDDEGEYAKILDFGVAKVGAGSLEHSAGVKTQTGMMIGTPFYMSPEQAKAKQVDHRADIWALAVITYEALTGKRPFTGGSFADLVINICSMPIPLPSRIGAVPRGFDEWFVHGTQRDVEKRFKSTRDMANELMQLVDAPIVGRRSDELSAVTAVGAGGPVRPARQAEARAAEARPAVAAATPAVGQGAGRSAGRSADARLDLTTGQRASTGYEAPSAPRAGGKGQLALLGVAALAVVGGALALVLRPGPTEPAAAGEPSTVTAQPPTPPAVAPTPAPPAATPPVAPSTAEPDAPAAAPVAVDAKADTTAADKAADAKKADAKKAAADKPADKPAEPVVEKPASSSRVPVVDKSSLPPKDWNF